MIEEILGVKINFDKGYDDIIREVAPILKKDSKLLVCTTNPYFIVKAQTDSEIKRIINNSYMSVPDGVGIFYAKSYLDMTNRLQFNKYISPFSFFIYGIVNGIKDFLFHKDKFLPITGIQLSEELLKLADKEHLNVYLLGGALRDKQGKPVLGEYDMAQHAAQIIKQKYKGINYVSGTSQFSRNSSDDLLTTAYILKDMQSNAISHIDILLIAYDPIHQEKWFDRNKNKLNVGLCVGVGRKLDYITNNMKEPDEVYKKLHIEWLYSLMINPWRYKRILDSVIYFPLKIFLSSIKNH